ncbi:MAG: nitroreductase family protein [Thermodesulfobacteriota bacterium]|nr:nitroreductase family protein [Thermodesulfobacteriota bacterium]
MKNDETLSPLGQYTESMPWNAVEKVIMERRSIRSFKKEPVPDSMIRRILEAGRFAPSAGNMQPWRFIVINDPDMLAKMEKDALRIAKIFMFLLDYTRGGAIRRAITKPLAKLFIRFLPNELHAVPFGLLSQIAQDRTPVFHGAPTLILLVEDKRGVSEPATDIGICGQNMVLTAHSLGAGSCWIGLIKLLMYYPWWKKRFGIKYPYCLKDCLAIGYQKPKADGIVPRETQVVTWYDKNSNGNPRFEKQGE